MATETSPVGIKNATVTGETFNFKVNATGDLEINSDSLTGGTTRVLIKDTSGSGRVGIGTKFPSQQLHVVGNVFASGSCISGSDRRLKTDIKPLSGSLRKVLKLKAVSFRGNSRKYPDKISSGRQIGLIAQDVVKIIPQVVITDKNEDDFMYVDYARLTPVLAQAIQEQNELIQQQSAMIKELRERIRKLEKNRE